MNGLLIGIANTFFWFVPWYSWTQEFMGEQINMTQNGSHIGGIAYLLIAASILFAIFSYQKNHQLQIVFGSVQLGIALLLMTNGNLSWGLPAIAIASGAGIWIGIKEKKAALSIQANELKD